MTASEFQSLESHSDATVCSGFHSKTPKWSTKMHATKLLKGVLISKTLNSTSSDQESSSTSSPNTAPARGKRAFSSDHTLSPASLVPKKSSPTVRTTCLCAPTKHAGSFRCRLHRVTQKHWDGRPAHSSSASKASSSSCSLPANENSGKSLVSTPCANGLPVSQTGGMSRPGAARPSRLRMVVVAAQAEDLRSPGSPMLTEGSVKCIRVSTSTAVIEDVSDNEAGAPVSRMLHTST